MPYPYSPPQNDEGRGQQGLPYVPPDPLLGQAPNIGNMIANAYLNRRGAPGRMEQSLKAMELQSQNEVIAERERQLAMLMMQKKQEKADEIAERDWNMRQEIFTLQKQNEMIENKIKAYSLMKGKNALPRSVIEEIFGAQNVPQGMIPQPQGRRKRAGAPGPGDGLNQYLEALSTPEGEEKLKQAIIDPKFDSVEKAKILRAMAFKGQQGQQPQTYVIPQKVPISRGPFVMPQQSQFQASVEKAAQEEKKKSEELLERFKKGEHKPRWMP